MSTSSTPREAARSERNGYPVRIYANPLKLVLLFLFMSGVCAFFIWWAITPGAPTATLLLLIPLFGWGAIAYLTMIILHVVLRRPLLDIDARGWAYTVPFTFGEHFLPWDNIAGISIDVNLVRGVIPFRYLAVDPRRLEDLPHARRKALIRKLLMVWSSPGLSIPLTYVFLWASRAKVERLLHQIKVACAADLRLHHVWMTTTAR